MIVQANIYLSAIESSMGRRLNVKFSSCSDASIGEMDRWVGVR